MLIFSLGTGCQRKQEIVNGIAMKQEMVEGITMRTGYINMCNMVAFKYKLQPLLLDKLSHKE